MVGKLLNLLLGHRCSVLNDVVVDGEGGGDSCSMGYHVEVETLLIAWVFNKALINDCPRCWVFINIVSLFGEPGVDSLVNQCVENTRIVVWRKVLNHMNDVLYFVVNNLSLVTRAADTISIDGNLSR